MYTQVFTRVYCSVGQNKKQEYSSARTNWLEVFWQKRIAQTQRRGLCFQIVQFRLIFYPHVHVHTPKRWLRRHGYYCTIINMSFLFLSSFEFPVWKIDRLTLGVVENFLRRASIFFYISPTRFPSTYSGGREMRFDKIFRMVEIHFVRWNFWFQV